MFEACGGAAAARPGSAEAAPAAARAASTTSPFDVVIVRAQLLCSLFRFVYLCVCCLYVFVICICGRQHGVPLLPQSMYVLSISVGALVMRKPLDLASCGIMSCHVMWHHVLSCPVLSCPVMSCHGMAWHGMAYQIASCHIHRLDMVCSSFPRLFAVLHNSRIIV